MKEITNDDIAMVRRIVNRCSLPASVDREDVVQEGLVAMVDAAKRFTLDMCVAFYDYAAPRINGAIIDYLRQLDPLSRHQRKAVSDGLAQNIETVAMADYSDMHSPEPSPFQRVAAAETWGIVDGLPGQERAVVEQHYLHGRTLPEVSNVLRMQLWQVKLVKAQALKHIREAVAA